MREIKFRGLTKKGEWAYGSLVITTDGLPHKPAQHTKTWIIERSFGNGGWFNIRKKSYVLPETVEQLINKDESGVETYESIGDTP